MALISGEGLEGVRLTLTWVLGGSDPCDKCLSLAGKQWFNVSIYEPILIDSLYGPIWDLLSDVSLVHGRCRCQLLADAQVESRDLPWLSLWVGDETF